MTKFGLYLFALFLLITVTGALSVLMLPLFLWAHIDESPFFLVLMALAVWYCGGRVIFRRLRGQESPR